jgi:hypothetical protein
MFLLRLRRRPTLPFRPSSGLRSMESEKGLCPSWIASILPSSACLPRHRVNVGLTWMLRQQSWPPPNRRPSCRCWLRPTSPHRRLDPCVLVTPWSRDPGLSSCARSLTREHSAAVWNPPAWCHSIGSYTAKTPNPIHTGENPNPICPTRLHLGKLWVWV